MPMERVSIYIDGPNLLGAARATLGRRVWIDPLMLSGRLITRGTHEIGKIYYSETPYPEHVFKSSTFRRQQSFFGNIHKYIEEGKIVHIEGTYRIDTLRVPADIIAGLSPDVARVVGSLSWKRPIEKGGDVGLAVRMVRDCFQNNYDHAFVVTEDTDFSTAINIVTSCPGKKVSICYTNNTHRNARALTNRCKEAKFCQITRGDLQICSIDSP